MTNLKILEYMTPELIKAKQAAMPLGIDSYIFNLMLDSNCTNVLLDRADFSKEVLEHISANILPLLKSKGFEVYFHPDCLEIAW